MWIWASFDQAKKDLRYALRAMRKNVGFSTAAILSLALGIGANTAIFSLVNALILRSLPVRNPPELVQLVLVIEGRSGFSFGYPTIGALADRTEIFAATGGFASASFNLTWRDASERVPAAWVTGGYYPMLGIGAFAGRLLTADDDRPGAPPVAVLSYSYWETRFARDFTLIGRTLQIEGKPVTIVGVSPPGFEGANVGEAANLTMTAAAIPQLFPERASQLQSGSRWMRVLARLQPGISIAQAKSRLAVAWPQMASVAATPRMTAKVRQTVLTSSIDLVPGGTGWSNLRQGFRRPLLVLLALTGLVLLIACANFANLLLARGASRSKEIALRFAIGAGRWRIVRQLLTESLMLAVLGAGIGMGLAVVGSRQLVALLPGRPRVVMDLRPDVAVLLFTSGVALMTGILFGLVPALRATAMGPGRALKADAGITPRTRSRLLPTLVVTQVALSMVLLIGAGLFVRTLQNLEQLDPGFRSEGVLLAHLDARRAGYKDARLLALYQELLDQFARFPGVVSVSLSNYTPLSGGTWTEYVSIDGGPATTDAPHFNCIGPRFFETMRTPLIQGRDFDERDGPAGVRSAIVNEAFVRKFLPEGRVMGQQIAIANARYPASEIVGVVKDVALDSLREPAPPGVYLPYSQYPDMIDYASFEVRTSSVARTAASLREAMHARFPNTPAQAQVEGLTEQVQRSLAQERLLAALGACFGGLALVLAAVGLYGVLAYTVTRSTNEIGIRMALGAQRKEVLGMVFRGALRLLAGGIALGVPAAWAASRLVAAMLFGLTATDPVTFVGAAVLLGATAVAAAFLPALRASRVDPMVALRWE
ncbi:conserved membrane hypothetical protein [Candidatus Sulfopaludibacter sp. SbA3]|nr:conserved membrane hypothetical protein [Candidatus Sulfopaludibacter sp. SbA3]